MTDDLTTLKDVTFTDKDNYGSSIKLCYYDAVQNLAKEHIKRLVKEQESLLVTLKSLEVEAQSLANDTFSAQAKQEHEHVSRRAYDTKAQWEGYDAAIVALSLFCDLGGTQ